MSAAEMAMYRQLQKSYRIVQQQHNRWQQLQESTTPSIKLVSNLLEQYTACQRLNISETAVKCFPDVQVRLLTKIMAEVEKHMVDIRTAV